MELLKVEDLTFTYPRQKKDIDEAAPALEHVSFEIQEGEFIVVCGESGCGKTTLLKLLKRELAPFGEKSGKIWFRGVEQNSLTDREAACEIGYVLQNPENQTVTDKVWHELAFGLEIWGFQRRSSEGGWRKWPAFSALMTGFGKRPLNCQEDRSSF